MNKFRLWHLLRGHHMDREFVGMFADTAHICECGWRWRTFMSIGGSLTVASPPQEQQ